MSNLAVQASFNSGEWSPALYARVDMAKYRSGAALLENFFVDYRGGASTRPGTRYILQCKDSANSVRLIPFQASFDVGYVLEFGDEYIRFFIDGAPVLEDSFAISGATQANPCVITVVGNDFVIGDWIYIASVGGMTQLNGRYFIVANVVGNAVTLDDLNGDAVNSTGYTAYTSGGTAARVYTISSPYAAEDLALLKYAQNVNTLIICHPSYQPYALTLITATNWSLLPITFGSTASPPTAGLSFSTTGLTPTGGAYSYVITSVDANGQESVASARIDVNNIANMSTVAGSIKPAWTAVSGAVKYNVYRTAYTYFGAVPTGATFGFVGETTSTSFSDTNISPDFATTPPTASNPFEGAGVASVAVTNAGTYTSVPTATLIGAATIVGSLSVVLQVQGTPTISAAGTGYAIGDTILLSNGVVVVVATVGGAGDILTFEPITNAAANPGAVTSGSTPANPVAQISTSGVGVNATVTLVWGVGQVLILNPGAGYTATPTISFSAGAAAATATLSPTSNGYPSVPGFFQQRLVLAAPDGAPQTFYMSQPGAYYNFNSSSPVQSDDSIEGTLVSGQLNTIKAMVPQPSGLLILTSQASWLVNGGSGQGSPVSPSSIVANAQSFNGISDVPPIVANFDVLYVQAKGSIVRDSSYNIYANVFTGTDISVLSSHLFYGYEVLEWAWAEEPYKVVWAIRNDGVMLTLTFLKEQEFVGWAHSETDGDFKSVCVVTEDTSDSGEVDAVYTVVERTINGNTVKYIERIAERNLSNGASYAWCVDSGLQYVGSPATSFSGGEHLAGETVTGLADGEVIDPFTMPANGNFTLATAASRVVVGLPFTCKLQTLRLDLGEPTIQGKVKKIASVTARFKDTLNVEVGPDFDNLQPMKDLIVGNVSSMLTGQQTQVVSGLVTGDAREFPASAYTTEGQICFQQSDPLPATILGVMPAFVIGDSDGRGR